MIDLKKVRENIEGYKRICQLKRNTIDVDAVLYLDDQRKDLQKKIDDTKFAQKKAGETKDFEQAKSLKIIIQELETTYTETIRQLDTFLLTMPNSSLHPDIPDGASDDDNVEVKRIGIIPQFAFDPIDHVTLMKHHDMLDIERGIKLGGSRSYILKGDGMMLEQAVLQYALHKLVKKGFTPMNVPQIVEPSCLLGTGYFPGGEDDAYHLEKDDKWLIGTSEIPVTAYHMNEILDQSELPKTYCGYSPCYRREAGASGKDTTGLYRVHQFNKVEQVVILPEDLTLNMQRHERILTNAEEFLQDLQIPYRLIQLCTGDMSIGKYQSQDLECWMPSRGKYGETHSVSSLLDFQARRLNLRYRTQTGEIKYCYTMNNTFVATPRFLIALIENNQQADGTIRIPDVLVPYMGKQYIGK